MTGGESSAGCVALVLAVLVVLVGHDEAGLVQLRVSDCFSPASKPPVAVVTHPAAPVHCRIQLLSRPPMFVQKMVLHVRMIDSNEFLSTFPEQARTGQ